MLTKIADKYHELSHSEKLIADYFVKNRNDVINRNIHELAREIGTSSASISRFVRKVNNSNFSKAKVDLALNMQDDSGKSLSEVISLADQFDTLPARLLDSVSEYCRQTIEINGMDKFDRVIEAVFAADTVYLYGVGTSGLMAIDLQHKLIKIKKKCIYNFDSNFGIMGSRLTTKKDLVIAFSYSGRSKEVLIPVRRAIANQTKSISFTSMTKNPLSKLCDINFLIPNNEMEENRLSSLFQRYETLYIIDILFLGLAKKTVKHHDISFSDYRDLVGLLKEREI